MGEVVAERRRGGRLGHEAPLAAERGLEGELELGVAFFIHQGHRERDVDGDELGVQARFLHYPRDYGPRYPFNYVVDYIHLAVLSVGLALSRRAGLTNGRLTDFASANLGEAGGPRARG